MMMFASILSNYSVSVKAAFEEPFWARVLIPAELKLEGFTFSIAFSSFSLPWCSQTGLESAAQSLQHGLPPQVSRHG